MIKPFLNQSFTYWTKRGTSGSGVVYNTPASAKCRWQDKQQKVITNTGVEKMSRAVLYTTTQLNPEDKVYRGLSTSVTPITGSYAILSMDQMVDLFGKSIGYKYYL